MRQTRAFSYFVPAKRWVGLKFIIKHIRCQDAYFFSDVPVATHQRSMLKSDLWILFQRQSKSFVDNAARPYQWSRGANLLSVSIVERQTMSIKAKR